MSLNFSWVIENKLAGSRGPRSKQDLIFLKQRGVGALVRLVEPDEAWVTTKEVNEAGLHDYNEPVPDFTAPTLAQIDKIVTYIASHLQHDVPVGVSCNAGIGRSGVILGCYLVRTGFTARNALELIRKKRGRGPEAPEQTAAVEEYWIRTKSIAER